ncbi:glycosyltransferase 25 family member-like protein, partial [Leptotrombidium deliense]
MFRFRVTLLVLSAIVLSAVKPVVTVFGSDKELSSSLQVILLCHPYTKANVLPFTLAGIESQVYPKNRINIFIKTEVYNSVFDGTFNSSIPKFDFNRDTVNILRKWVKNNRDHYNDVDLQIDVLDSDDDLEPENIEYWSSNRFKKIMDLKNRALRYSRRKWADFVLFIDADVVLTNVNTFANMINKNHTIVSPMLYSLGTYSNFWAGITERGYYKRTDDYLPILERQTEGEFEVPMIHSCVFINLRKESSMLLTFNASELSDIPYDDIIAFAVSARRNSIPMIVNNMQVWGFILPPIENLELQELDTALVDLELEAISERSLFPISSSLLEFVKRPEKTKAGVDNIYLINLLRRPDRLEKMLISFNAMGLTVQLWPAVDGQKITEQYLSDLGIKVIPGYLDPYHKRPITYGEIGCFLSHYFIWEDMITRNLSKVIVLEDDVRFEQKFTQRMNKAVSALESAH